MFSLPPIIEKTLTAVFIIAIIAVVLSRNSQTTGVIQSISTALSNILGQIVKPIASSAPASAPAPTSAATAPTSTAAPATVTNPGTGNTH